MSVLQIKRKFIEDAAIDNEKLEMDAVDSTKLKLLAGQALRIVSQQDGSVKNLIELDSADKVKVNGEEVGLKSEITAEESRAMAAESALAADIATEAGLRAAADTELATSLQAVVQAEADARIAAVSAEQSARELGDSTLSASITEADTRLTQAILDEETARVAAVSAEQSARESADLVLDGKITTEQQRAEAAEASLQSAIDTEKGRIDAILLASDADKDSFAEIVNLINSVDTENDSAFASYVLSNNQAVQEVEGRLDVLEGPSTQSGSVAYAVKAEETRAMAAESELQSAISAEQARAEAAEADLLAFGNAIQSQLLEADNLILGQISVEVTRAEQAEAALDARLDVIEGSGVGSIAKAQSDAQSYADAAVLVEKTRAEAAEAGLSASLSAEIADREAAIEAVEASLAAETSARIAAVSAEESARIAAVSAEQTRAEGAESALSARLDVLEGSGEGSVAKAEADAKAYTDQKVADLVNSAPEVLDTLKELADAINGDENFATTVAGQIGQVASDLAAAESALQSSIEAEETRALAAEATLQSNIEAAQSGANSYTDAAVLAEQTRAESAESALDGRLDVLEARSFYKMKFVVSAQDLTNGFIELGHVAMPSSIVASVGRLMIHEGESEDFTVSEVGGKTRMTFVGNMVSPSEEALSENDVIYVRYMA